LGITRAPKARVAAATLALRRWSFTQASLAVGFAGAKFLSGTWKGIGCGSSDGR